MKADLKLTISFLNSATTKVEITNWNSHLNSIIKSGTVFTSIS